MVGVGVLVAAGGHQSSQYSNLYVEKLRTEKAWRPRCIRIFQLKNGLRLRPPKRRDTR